MTGPRENDDITLFNIADRFYMCRRKLLDLGEVLEQMTTKEHPDIMDLCGHYALIRTIANGLATKLEPPRNQRVKITEKDLRNVSKLEILVHELQDTINEAAKELLAA